MMNFELMSGARKLRPNATRYLNNGYGTIIGCTFLLHVAGRRNIVVFVNATALWKHVVFSIIFVNQNPRRSK